MEIDHLFFGFVAIFVKLKHVTDSELSYLHREVVLVCHWYNKSAHKLDPIYHNVRQYYLAIS